MKLRTSSFSSFSSSVCGAGEITPSVLQLIEAYCACPSFSSPVHLQRRSKLERHERPLLAKAELMGEKWQTKFSLTNAAKLQHSTDGYTSPPKQGMPRIFSPEKSDGFRLGLNPRTRGQHANH
jgi:hypothetical protein